MRFSDIVLHWYYKNKREFPWRKTKNTYNVWVSEIILQQTQTSQGLSYYTKLIDTFPTVKDLAKAKEEKILNSEEQLEKGNKKQEYREKVKSSFGIKRYKIQEVIKPGQVILIPEQETYTLQQNTFITI